MRRSGRQTSGTDRGHYTEDEDDPIQGSTGLARDGTVEDVLKH